MSLFYIKVLHAFVVSVYIIELKKHHGKPSQVVFKACVEGYSQHVLLYNIVLCASLCLLFSYEFVIRYDTI